MENTKTITNNKQFATITLEVAIDTNLTQEQLQHELSDQWMDVDLKLSSVGNEDNFNTEILYASATVHDKDMM